MALNKLTAKYYNVITMKKYDPCSNHVSAHFHDSIDPAFQHSCDIYDTNGIIMTWAVLA